MLELPNTMIERRRTPAGGAELLVRFGVFRMRSSVEAAAGWRRRRALRVLERYPGPTNAFGPWAWPPFEDSVPGHGISP